MGFRSKIIHVMTTVNKNILIMVFQSKIIISIMTKVGEQLSMYVPAGRTRPTQQSTCSPGHLIAGRQTPDAGRAEPAGGGEHAAMLAASHGHSSGNRRRVTDRATRPLLQAYQEARTHAPTLYLSSCNWCCSLRKSCSTQN